MPPEQRGFVDWKRGAPGATHSATAQREIVAVFHESESLERAISALTSAGWDRSELSLLAQHGVLEPEPITERSRTLADDAGAEREAVISDPDIRQGRTLAAGMAGVVGAFIASGATILTGGTALAAIIGAAVVGGGATAAVDAIGRRIGQGHEDHLHQQVMQGGILLWVRLRDAAQEDTARRILTECGASDIHLHDPAAESASGTASPSAATRKPDPVDEASLESFPASDPPAWIPSSVGSTEGQDPAQKAKAEPDATRPARTARRK